MNKATGAPLPLTDEELRKALTAMHVGLVNMQARLDDHEKVIEKMMLVMQELTVGQVPNGFRQPKKAN
jgi:hypothetical protein